MRVAALFDSLHSVGVIHGDVEERHVIGPKDDVSQWRLIDFDQATTVDEIPKGRGLLKTAGEHYFVQMRFHLSPDVWFLEPRRIFKSSFTSASPAIASNSPDGFSILQQKPKGEAKMRDASSFSRSSEKPKKTRPRLGPEANNGKTDGWRLGRRLSKLFHAKTLKLISSI